MSITVKLDGALVIEAFAVITGVFLSGSLISYDLLCPSLTNILAGLLMSLYTITMPVLVKTSTSAPLLLQQWQRIFNRGHIQGPALAVMTGIAYGYAAWLRATSGGSWSPFVLAAVLTFALVPYTWIFMNGINSALFEAVEQSGKDGMVVDKQRAESMIIAWSGFHAVRSLFPLAGAVVGCLAMLKVMVM